MENNLNPVRRDDPFLSRYQPSELRIASEFLATWKSYLCRDLCHHCTEILSVRIRSLHPDRLNLEENEACSSSNYMESQSISDSCDTNSHGSRKDAAEISSMPNRKDGTNGCSEHNSEASKTSGLSSDSPPTRISWADMAQRDELDEEEQHGSNEQIVDTNLSSSELRSSEDHEKPQLSWEQREYIRFMNVTREKNFICWDKIKGKMYNILEGLELHTGVFSSAEQKRIVDYVYVLLELGKKKELKERTYTAPQKWMRGKGRITIQFGCCYNYAKDKNGNPPGILQDDIVDPLPHLLKVIIRRLVRWHILPPTCVPDSCIINIYEEGDCIPPHIDSHDFVRPFCTVSFLSECNIVFGSNLKVVGAGEFSGSIAIPLPVGSVLVLNGNAADLAKHCVPAVPTKRISITFRRMDESKRPIGYAPEPDLRGIEPLSYGMEKTSILNCPTSDCYMKRQPRIEVNEEGREPAKRNHVHSEPQYSSQRGRRPANKPRARLSLLS